MRRTILLIACACCVSAPIVCCADDAPPWWKRATVFSETAAIKSNLHDVGLDFDLVWTGEYFSNLHGGIRTGHALRGDLSLNLALDTGKLGLWSDGTLSALFQIERGGGISADDAGSFQNISNIEAEDLQQVTELWYEHRFLNDNLWIRFGLQDFARHFSSADHGSEFLNASPGVCPTVPIVTYPYTDIGVAAGWKAAAWYQIEASVSRGRGSEDTKAHGTMCVVEQTLMFQPFDRAGSLSVAFFKTSAPYRDLRRRQIVDGVRGWFLTFDQFLWHDPEGGGQEGRHVGIFVQFGSSPPDRVESRRFLGLGMEIRGPMATRPDDILGLGTFHLVFSEYFPHPAGLEQVYESYYKCQLLPWLSIKPDIQLIINPGGEDRPMAVAAGLRVQMSL